MSSTLAMPMDTSAGKTAGDGDMKSFKSFSDDNGVDNKPSTDDSSEGGDEPVVAASVVADVDADKHSSSNGHGEVKKVTPTPETSERTSPVKAQPDTEVKKTEEEEEFKSAEEDASKEDDESDGEDEKKDDEHDTKTEEVVRPGDADEVDGKGTDTAEDTKAETDGEKKPKGKPGRKAKATKAKKPSAGSPTATSAPRAKKPRVSADATIGELDTPVAEQVKSDGLRRERKQVERFVPTTPVREVKTPGVVEEGRGTKLGDIEYVAAMINSKKAADLTSLHRLCFGRNGKSYEIKKNLKSFSGFTFEAGSKEYISRKTSISKWSVKVLGDACAILGIKKPGVRDLMVDAILEFCLKPDEDNVERKAPPAGKRRSSGARKRKSSSPAKKGRKSKESSKPKAKGKSKAVKRKKESEDEEEESGHDESHESEPEPQKESDEEDVAPPKKKQKTEKPQKVKEKVLAAEKSRSRALPSRSASSGKKYNFDDNEGEEGEDELGYQSAEETKKSKSPKKRSHEQTKKKPAAVDSDFELQQEDEGSDVEKKKPKKSDTKSEKKSEKSKSSSGSKKSSFKPPKKVAEDKEDEAFDDVKEKERASTSEDEAPQKKSKPLPAEFGSDAEVEAASSKKSDGFPTDSELRKVVSETVKSSDLKQVTMKMMLQTIYSKFPDVDLTPKKDFIKAAVKDLL